MSEALTRKIHDLHSAVASKVKKLKRVDVPPPEALIEQWQIQKAGTHTFDNRFETAVLGTQETTTGYAWPDAYAYRLRDVSLAGSGGHVFFSDGSLFNVDRSRA